MSLLDKEFDERIQEIVNFNSEPYVIEPLRRLARDVKNAVKTITPSTIRFFVDKYYQFQKNRIAFKNQIRSEEGEPNEVVNWLYQNLVYLEADLKSVLDAYTDADPVGRWAKGIVGIGPVLSAGLLAHIDITKAETVGSIWRYAGLDPTLKWEKGEKRPWNARLKSLCWKIGESFVKVRNNPKDVYGKIYWKRKIYEWEKNIRGDYAGQVKKVGKNTEAYLWYSGSLKPKEEFTGADFATAKTGEHKRLVDKVGEGRGVLMLPPGHIHERAKRKAVKLFLAHWHEVAYENHYGRKPPKPYPIAILGHVHEIKRPE